MYAAYRRDYDPARRVHSRLAAHAPVLAPVLMTPSPPYAPHTLAVICESTYGVSRHLPRAEREALLLSSIRDTIARGGRVLLPVVALGRAQVRIM